MYNLRPHTSLVCWSRGVPHDSTARSEAKKMVKCPCGRSSSEAKEPKTVNIFQGYFFMVNFCLGTGFLGVPFSFFYGGYIAAVPTLAAAAFMTWLTSTWLLEVMARAQVSVLDTEWIKTLRGV